MSGDLTLSLGEAMPRAQDTRTLKKIHTSRVRSRDPPYHVATQRGGRG